MVVRKAVGMALVTSVVSIRDAEGVRPTVTDEVS